MIIKLLIALQILHIALIQQGRISRMRRIDSILSYVKNIEPDADGDARILCREAGTSAASAEWTSTSGNRYTFVTLADKRHLEAVRE